MPGPSISRRTMLLALGVAAGAGATGAAGDKAGWFTGGSSTVQPASVTRWTRDRGPAYFVAHRGSGDVLPEHSLPAYRAARDWGAQAMEVSVAMTSDGALICMHDLTYDRTTNISGRIASLPSSVLKEARIVQPQLGPRWVQDPPEVPLLQDVLTELGGKVVLCLEAKDDAAYPAMMDMVERHGLHDSVVVKAFWRSGRIEQAQRAGYAVFGYLGTGDLQRDVVTGLGSRLRRGRDYLGLPASDPGGSYLSDDLVRYAVSQGVAVWVYPVHRRAEAAHYFSLGVAGAVSSSYGYMAGRTRLLTADTWATRAVAPGEMSRHPEQPSSSPSWTGKDELTLARGSTQYVTLGQLSPVRNAEAAYRIDLQARWSRTPSDPQARLSIVFGHVDDAYYEPGLGSGSGYEAFLRPDGALGLRAHAAGSPAEIVLADAASPAPKKHRWVSLRLSVTPTVITWSRTDLDADAAVTRDLRSRGGYVHIGRTSSEVTAVAFRGLRIS